MKTLILILTLCCALGAQAAPPAVVSPVNDTVVAIETGAEGVDLVSEATSDTQPTATLWVDLGWSFFAGSVRPAFQLPVQAVGPNRWQATVRIFAPYVWQPLPQLETTKRWIVWSNGDGAVPTGKTQLLSVARGTNILTVTAQ